MRSIAVAEGSYSNIHGAAWLSSSISNPQRMVIRQMAGEQTFS